MVNKKRKAQQEKLKLNIKLYFMVALSLGPGRRINRQFQNPRLFVFLIIAQRKPPMQNPSSPWSNSLRRQLRHGLSDVP
jgi:hypothetical protein